MSYLALASAKASVAMNNAIVVAAEKAPGEPGQGGFDPGVTPNSDAPWFSWFQDFTGSVVGTLILAAVLLLAIGVTIALIGRAVSSQGAQRIGIGALVVGLIGVVLLGGISGLVFWLTGQSLF